MGFGGGVQGSGALATGSDVNLSNVVNGEALQYDSSIAKWKNTSSPLSRDIHTGVQSVSTVTNLQTYLDQKASRALTKRNITANYTLVLADEIDVLLHSTATTAITITLPSDTVAINLEVPLPWRQYGAGQVTFAAGASATLISRGAVFNSAGQYAGGTITKVATSTWLLEGDIVA